MSAEPTRCAQCGRTLGLDDEVRFLDDPGVGLMRAYHRACWSVAEAAAVLAPTHDDRSRCRHCGLAFMADDAIYVGADDPRIVGFDEYAAMGPEVHGLHETCSPANWVSRG